MSYTLLVQFSLQKAHDSIRKAIAGISGISPLRISHLHVSLHSAQCVKVQFFTRKIQFFEKFEKWSIFIFRGKKIEIHIRIFAPKLVKNFVVLFGQCQVKIKNTLLNFGAKIQIRRFIIFRQNSIFEQKYDFLHSVSCNGNANHLENPKHILSNFTRYICKDFDLKLPK